VRRVILSSIAALAILAFAASDANAGPRWGVSVGYGGGYWGGGPGYSVSYGTRVGNGFLSVGYSNYAYPSYGYYSTPVYYSRPYYYGTPVYNSRPYYYGGYSSYPSYGWRYGW
jgi:hypothetical protein